MPLCYIFTNMKSDDIEADLEIKLQECVAEILQKPEERISIMLNTGIRMRFAGKEQPGLVCNIHSIKVFDEQKSPGYFPRLFEVLTAATKLPASSITIEFTDLAAYNAMNGSALPKK